MITLTLQQSLDLISPYLKRSYFKNNYQIYTRTQVPCLHCGEPVYVPYTQINTRSIFCPTCYEEFARKRTIVQYHYMKHVKQNQLDIVTRRLPHSGALPEFICRLVDEDFDNQQPLIKRPVLIKRTRLQNTPQVESIDFLEDF